MRGTKGPTLRLFPKLVPRVVRNWDEGLLCCAGLTSVTIGGISSVLG